MTWNRLSAFSLASFEMNAQMGGTHRFADAVSGVEDQISLSPQAMGMLGVTPESEPESTYTPAPERESEERINLEG